MKNLIFVIYFILLNIIILGSYSNASQCSKTMLTNYTSDKIIYEGWTSVQKNDDAPSGQYEIIQKQHLHNIRKKIPVLNSEIVNILQEKIESGAIVLVFDHPTIGGFVSGPEEKFSIYVSKILGLNSSKTILAINKKSESLDLIAHELVHYNDYSNNTVSNIRNELTSALASLKKNTRNNLVELLTRYIVEYRAENKTVFYEKDIDQIREEYRYQSYIESASYVPNEIFYSSLKIFKLLPTSQQKEIKPILNRIIKKWTLTQDSENFLEVKQLK